MKKIAFIIALLVILFTASNAMFTTKPIERNLQNKHFTTYYKGDPLGRNHWTYGHRARIQKQLMQAQYHQQRVERAEAAQAKVAREQRRAHLLQD